MALTVIPAPDMSGANEGWRILAESVEQRRRERHAKEAAYQDLVVKLSDPNTTEDQQNAILSQDPKVFENTYGVKLAQVGKDIATFRTAASAPPVTAPGASPMAPGAAPTDIAPGKMQMSNAALAPGESTTRRVLVPHPGGTAQEQQQRATLENTRANTEAERARTAQGRAAADLSQTEMSLRIGNATNDVKKTMRTADGRVPTFNEVQGYLVGKVELTPLKPEVDTRERVAYLLGQDPADPVGRVLIHDFQQSQDMNANTLEKAVADKDGVLLDNDLKRRELEMIDQGLNPRTGRPMTPGLEIKPNELASLSKSWNDATEHAMRGLGMPSQVTTDTQRVAALLPGTGVPFSVAAFQKQTIDNPKISAMLFGNGRADPASVRADLLASVPEGTRIKTINFPTIDQKTGLMTTTPLTIDQAVPRVVQMRQSWTTELPGLFNAMRQASPGTLAYMVFGNPMIEQASRAYAPDLVAKIDAARKAAVAADNPSPTANPLLQDPNTSSLVPDLAKLNDEIANLKKMLQGAGATPGAK